jgi:hypothetical protein
MADYLESSDHDAPWQNKSLCIGSKILDSRCDFSENTSINNLVPSLAIKIENPNILQECLLCHLPSDLLSSIIQCVYNLKVPESELQSFKQGLLSLFSTCYSLYSKSRDLFKINITKYIDMLKGEYLSKQYVSIFTREYWNSQPGVRQKGGFPFVYAFHLDSLSNKIEGKFSMASGVGNVHCKVNIINFEIQPIFGEHAPPKLKQACAIHQSSGYGFLSNNYNNNNDQQLRTVSSRFHFNGFILRLLTTQQEWDSLQEDEKLSLLEREERIDVAYRQYSSCSANSRVKGTQCVFSEVFAFQNDGSDKDQLIIQSLSPLKLDSPKGMGELNKFMEGCKPMFYVDDPQLEECGIGEENLQIGQEHGCCFDAVSTLVNQICVNGDEKIKYNLTKIVAMECVKPPGMNHEELTFRILSLYNESKSS